MATALTAPTVAAYTSGDISVGAGLSVVFSVTGTHNGAPIEIRKKDSQGAYWVMIEAVAGDNLEQSTISGAQRMMTITNPSVTAFTIQVYKPPSGIASGIDQD